MGSKKFDFQPRRPSRFQPPIANAAMSSLQVFEDTRLDAMLDLFKLGRTHMVMVMHINNDVRRWWRAICVASALPARCACPVRVLSLLGIHFSACLGRRSTPIP